MAMIKGRLSFQVTTMVTLVLLATAGAQAEHRSNTTQSTAGMATTTSTISAIRGRATEKPPTDPAICPSTTNLRHGRHFQQCHSQWKPNSLEWTSNNMEYQGMIAVDLVRPIGCRARVKQWRMKLTGSCLLKMVILSEDSVGDVSVAMASTIRHFTEKASVSAYMHPDRRGVAMVNLDQIEETLEVEKGNIVAIVHLNSTSSSSCLCFAPSRRGGKLWSALYHGHIEAGPSTGNASRAPEQASSSSAAVAGLSAALGRRSGEISRAAAAVAARKRRQAPGNANADVFLLQAQVGRLAWGLTLDTTLGAGDLDSRHINFFGDDSDTAAPGSESSPSPSSSPAPTNTTEQTTASSTTHPDAASDSIIIGSYVSERVFGLTGSMQLIFDLTSLRTVEASPLPNDDVATTQATSSISKTSLIPQRVNVEGMITVETNMPSSSSVAADSTVLPGGNADDDDGDDNDYVLPLLICGAAVVVFGGLLLIVVLCVQCRRRRSVSRKVYSKHIFNSTAASMERERRRQVGNRRKRTARDLVARRRDLPAPLECIRPQPTADFYTAATASRSQFRDAHDALTVRHTVSYSTAAATGSVGSEHDTGGTDNHDVTSAATPSIYNNYRRPRAQPSASTATDGTSIPAMQAITRQPRTRLPQRTDTFESPIPRVLADPPPPSIPASRLSIRVHVAKDTETEMAELESQPHTLVRPQLSDIPERDSRAVSDRSHASVQPTASYSKMSEYSSSPLNSIYLNQPPPQQQQQQQQSQRLQHNEYDDTIAAGNDLNHLTGFPQQQEEVFEQEESEFDTDWDTDGDEMEDKTASPFDQLAHGTFPIRLASSVSQEDVVVTSQAGRRGTLVSNVSCDTVDTFAGPRRMMSSSASHDLAAPRHSNATLESVFATSESPADPRQHDSYHEPFDACDTAAKPARMQETHYHSSVVTKGDAVAAFERRHPPSSPARHSHYHATDITIGSLAGGVAMGTASGHVISAETRSQSVPPGGRGPGAMATDIEHSGASVHLYTLPLAAKRPPKPTRRASSVRASTLASQHQKHQQHSRMNRRKSNGATLDNDNDDSSSSSNSNRRAVDKLLVQFRRESGEMMRAQQRAQQRAATHSAYGNGANA